MIERLTRVFRTLIMMQDVRFISLFLNNLQKAVTVLCPGHQIKLQGSCKKLYKGGIILKI